MYNPPHPQLSTTHLHPQSSRQQRPREEVAAPPATQPKSRDTRAPRWLIPCAAPARNQTASSPHTVRKLPCTQRPPATGSVGKMAVTKANTILIGSWVPAITPAVIWWTSAATFF